MSKKDKLKLLVQSLDFQQLIDISAIQQEYMKMWNGEWISSSLIIKTIGKCSERIRNKGISADLKKQLKSLINLAGGKKPAQRLLNFVNY